MKLYGAMTNITAFSAFVDIGVHQDGLVHISQMSDRFVKSPAEVVKVQQKVSVTLFGVDFAKNRTPFSMKLHSDHSESNVKKSGLKKLLSKTETLKEKRGKHGTVV